MDNNINKFRKAAFGGFNRKDVIDYIEKIQNEFFDYKKETEKTVERLNEKITQLESLCSGVERPMIEAEEKADASEQMMEENDSAGEINMATAKLRNVTEELCRSLNDFMEKLSENSISVMLDIPCEESSEEEQSYEAVTCEGECVEPDRVQSILDRVSCAFVQENKTYEKLADDNKREKKTGKAITDVLNSASFIC